jgi:predicted CoA-binding protein
MEVTERILRQFSVIAVVGMSRDPSKAAHAIPAKLSSAGFDVIPVNPHTSSILGLESYPTLAAVPRPVEVVLVFRPSEDTPEIAAQAVAISAKALWLQQGIQSEVARARAEAAGLLYVEDRCIGVERARYQITKTKASG